MTQNIDNFLALAMQLCNEAALQTTAFFRKPVAINVKADLSPVTIADQQTEQHLRGLINAQYPDHAIIGEEFGHSGDSEWQWVIDPIDGTRSFISGHPLYACLIALLHDNEPVLSIIDMPILRERFHATRHSASYLNDRPITVSKIKRIEEAKLYSTDPIMFNAEQLHQRGNVSQVVSLDRFGGDGYLYAMLAAGWIDLVIEADLKPYDFLPLKLIVEQAGGVISDWQGNPLTIDSAGEVVASATPFLHEQVLKRLAN